MSLRFLHGLAISALVVVSSCASRPEVPPPIEKEPAFVAAEPVAAKPEEVVVESVLTPAPLPSPPVVESFDPAKVSEAVKVATFADAKELIDKLNMLIQTKNFEAWQAYLTDEYRSYYSDPAVLAKFSESIVLKRDGIVLRSLQDYFLSVVYRSRQNARLDDIDFIGADRIIALTVSPKGERLILYYLERVADMWKIGIGR